MPLLTKRMKELIDIMTRLFEKHYESGLAMITSRFFDHLRDGLEKCFSIRFLDGALNDHFTIVLKRTYSTSFESRAIRMKGKASTLKSNVDRLRKNGSKRAIAVHSPVKSNQMQTLEEAGYFILRNELWSNWYKVLTMNLRLCSWDVEQSLR